MAGLTLAPATVVDEREHWTIAVNRNQNLVGKTMLVLRRECDAVTDLTAEEWAAAHVELRRVCS